MNREKLVLYTLGLIGLFVMGSLVAQVWLLSTDKIQSDEGVWRPLFDLVAILVGATAGYLGGVEVERTRKNGGHDDG